MHKNKCDDNHDDHQNVEEAGPTKEEIDHESESAIK